MGRIISFSEPSEFEDGLMQHRSNPLVARPHAVLIFAFPAPVYPGPQRPAPTLFTYEYMPLLTGYLGVIFPVK